jgi:protein TonB
LAESLWRRVAELKRYPNSARMNGQEGKVILKAVIRSDGQLADVFVQKSSGYSALDQAAIEAVKLACPLHMKHAIGKPQIVVSLPIVYSLAN